MSAKSRIQTYAAVYRSSASRLVIRIAKSLVGHGFGLGNGWPPLLAAPDSFRALDYSHHDLLAEVGER